MTHCLQLFTMEPFLYLDESMQHTIQDSRDGGVADIDFSHQVAQSSTQQGDCEPVLMDEDRPVPEDQDESEENEDDDDEKDEEWCEEEVSSVQCSLSLYTLRDLLVYHHRQWERRQPLTVVMARNHHLTQKGQNPVNNVSLNLVQELQLYKKSGKTKSRSLKLARTRLGRRHTRANIVDGALLGVEILKLICGKYILQLMKKLLISCLTKTNSAHTVLTLPSLVVICSVTSVLTLERSHTHARNVGGALLTLHILLIICAVYILQQLKKFLVSKYISAHTVLTLLRLLLISRVTSVLTLERSHTLARYVGGHMSFKISTPSKAPSTIFPSMASP